MSYTVSGNLSVNKWDFAKGLDAVRRSLTNAGWAVISADGTDGAPFCSWWNVGAGCLVPETQPATFVIDKPGQTQADALVALNQAVLDAGYASTKDEVNAALHGIANNVPSPKDALSSVKTIAIAVAVVVGAGALVYLIANVRALAAGVKVA